MAVAEWVHCLAVAASMAADIAGVASMAVAEETCCLAAVGMA